METNEPVVNLKLDLLIPNTYQPRKSFNENTLNELALSIREYGVINPILVRQQGDKYEIIAGERRVRAAKKLGLIEIPAIIKSIDDEKMAEIALIENLQRENLTPIEEAESYDAILKKTKITENKLSEMIGKSQSSISNKIRLLNLPETIKNALLERKISERHARALLQIESDDKKIELLQTILNEKLTVKELEQIIKKENKKEEKESENMNNENLISNMNNNMNLNNNNNMIFNQPNVQQMPAPAAPQVDIMPMNNQMPNMTEPLMPMPSMMPSTPDVSEMAPSTQVINDQQATPIPDYGINNQPQFNAMPEFNMPTQTEPKAAPVADMNIPNTIGQSQGMEPLNSFPLFESQNNIPENSEPKAAPVADMNIPNTMEQIPVTPEIPPMVDAPLFTQPTPSVEMPVQNEITNAISESAYEIPVTTTPVQEVDKFMQVKELLNNNGIVYKAYSNETGHCIIIEL